MQQFADNSKISPVATLGFGEELYLRHRLKHQISKVARPPISRDDWPAYEYLRDLARRLRPNCNSKGFGNWWAMIFAAACVGLLAVIVFTHQPKIYIYQAPSSLSPIGDTFQILQKGTDPNHWQMRRQHYEHNALVSSLNFWTTSCDQVPFSPGETLTWLAYEDRGNCWSVSSKILGYTFLRDAEGNVKLAPNCRWITDVLATCKGEPKW